MMPTASSLASRNGGPATVRTVSGARVAITGVAQGVGFRPFVHRLALRNELAGWVRNEAGGVEIAVEGSADAIDAFVIALEAEAPPLARLDTVRVDPVPPTGLVGFAIAVSADDPNRRQPVSPDVALCAACASELDDPTDRRYRYPFTTCTDCGPRFTIIEAMPYDRERTSMRAFPQCPSCRAEYEDPAGRRYRSETNSCGTCGPRLWIAGEDADAPVGGRDYERAIAAAADALTEGRIVAIRGLGGFHLAVDATDEEAVRTLRSRKGREAKPLAVMVRGLEEVRRLAEVGTVEERLLRSRERPIVLLRRRPDAGLAPSVAPGLDTIGVITAYTPLHHGLLERVGRPLVMTSGNASDEPIAIANGDAFERLGTIADLFLLHDREIVSRYDDSVVRVVGDATVFLRRARGYAPLPLELPVPAPVPLVAVGPHLKNTFTLAHETAAYVSQHVGDLENLETLAHFEDSLDRFQRLFRIHPRAVARDLHPGYLSTAVAAELGIEPVIEVQHHHAHVAAVAAEHGLRDPVIGLAFDGTGYGEDGCVWGAEVLVADLHGYERVGQLRYAPLPGGDLAVRRPWRVALGYLSLEPSASGAFAAAFDDVPAAELEVARRQIEAGLNAPLASSMGRLFDAAAAVLGIRRVARYEGQAAMELEALAGRRPASPLPFPLLDAGPGRWIFDPIPLLVALGEGVRRGQGVEDLAARFHESVALAAVELARRAAEAAGLRRVAVSGGVFQNARLLWAVRQGFESAGLEPLLARRLGPNDGAISYGQAAIAACILQGG
jgi:hydrogenase maturation protein HypF